MGFGLAYDAHLHFAHGGPRRRGQRQGQGEGGPGHEGGQEEGQEEAGREGGGQACSSAKGACTVGPRTPNVE